MKKKVFNFEWSGTDLSDLCWALEIARQQVGEGMVEGTNSNADGRYFFQLKKDES